jgi:glycerol-3-phosphate dehydrogenase
MRLKDFYLRRVHLFLAEADHGRRFLPDIAQVFTQELGWSQDEVQKQIAELEAHQSHEMGWQM